MAPTRAADVVDIVAPAPAKPKGVLVPPPPKRSPLSADQHKAKAVPSGKSVPPGKPKSAKASAPSPSKAVLVPRAKQPLPPGVEPADDLAETAAEAQAALESLPDSPELRRLRVAVLRLSSSHLQRIIALRRSGYLLRNEMDRLTNRNATLEGFLATELDRLESRLGAVLSALDHAGIPVIDEDPAPPAGTSPANAAASSSAAPAAESGLQDAPASAQKVTSSSDDSDDQGTFVPDSDQGATDIPVATVIEGDASADPGQPAEAVDQINAKADQAILDVMEGLPDFDEDQPPNAEDEAAVPGDEPKDSMDLGDMD